MKPTHFLSKRALPPVFLTLGFTSLFTLMGMTLTLYWPADAFGSGTPVHIEASVRSSATPEPVTVSVVITGAIQHPGVYQVSAHARLEEVVALAGGSTEDAALLPRGLLAQGIYAGQIVHIPAQPAQQLQRTRRVDPGMIKTVAGTHRKPKKRSSHQTPLATGPIKKIDINRADLKALVTLPGVGPALAKRIIQARKQKPFANAKELISRVKGIGPAKYKKIAGWVK